MSVLDVHEVVDSVMALVRSRPGRLVAVTVASPPSVSPEDVALRVKAELVAAGEGRVEVNARAGGGPLRLVAAEFAR